MTDTRCTRCMLMIAKWRNAAEDRQQQMKYINGREHMQEHEQSRRRLLRQLLKIMQQFRTCRPRLALLYRPTCRPPGANTRIGLCESYDANRWSRLGRVSPSPDAP